MGMLSRGKYLRQLRYGLTETRNAAVVPQTGTQAIFNITGGRVVITSIVGVVTGAGSATVTNLKFRVAPSVGAAQDLSANGLVTSAAVGTFITATGVAADATVVNSAIGSMVRQGIVLPAGAIQIVTDANNATLAVQWTVTWMGLDDAAVLAAA